MKTRCKIQRVFHCHVHERVKLFGTHWVILKTYAMNFRRMYRTFLVGAGITVLSAFVQGHQDTAEPRLNMPYKKMGLTQEQAAAHLLNRFTFGIRPGQVKEVVDMGLDNWLLQQLDGKLPDEEVNRRLPAANYEALTMNNEDIVNRYLNAGQIIRVAAKNNLLNKDSVRNLDKPEYREQLKKLMDEQGYKLPQELHRQLVNFLNNSQLHMCFLLL